MIKVDFEAVNSGNHGSPGTILLTKIYNDSGEINHFPSVGEIVMIQYGSVREQSSHFKVEKIDKWFTSDKDMITYWVAAV